MNMLSDEMTMVTISSGIIFAVMMLTMLTVFMRKA